MRKYAFDLAVNAIGHKYEIVASRRGRPIAYWDAELCRAYCTPEAYRKNSPNVVMSAIRLIESIKKPEGVKHD